MNYGYQSSISMDIPMDIDINYCIDNDLKNENIYELINYPWPISQVSVMLSILEYTGIDY